jgi:alpha-mannosidase
LGKVAEVSGQQGDISRRSFLQLLAAASSVLPVIGRATDADAEPLYLLSYDHGGAVLWGTEKLAQTLRSAVEWLERYPSFKIGLDNEAYTYDFLAEQEPELLEELRGCLKRFPGRLAIGTATYGQPLSCFINEESNIRQLEYAREVNQRLLGAAPPIYAMSEHAMHSQIPQLLRGFGFAGALMRTHYQMYGYNPMFDEPIGYWIGLDGSGIPAVPTYKGEGAEFGKTTEDNWILTRYPGPECHETLEDFRRKFGCIHPALASRVDDAPLRREELVKQYEGRPGYRWILLEELLAAFPKPMAELRTAPNDFVVRMPWGYCGNEIWNRCRQAEVAVLTAERLAALAKILGGRTREDQLTRAWKNVLVAQHHDVQITGLVADARHFLNTSMQASAEVSDPSLRYVAARMAGGAVAQITVFNPHSWQRKEWTEVDLLLPPGTKGWLTAQRDGRWVPCHVVSTQVHADGSLRSARLAIQVEVPGLAFVSYSIESSEEPPGGAAGLEIDEAQLQLQTSDWTIRLDPQGGIAEWRYRRSGRPVLRPGKRAAFFAGRIDDQDCESRGGWSLLPSPGARRWVTARETGEVGGLTYVFDFTVRADSPRVDCHMEFKIDNQRIGLVSDEVRDAHSAFVHEHKLRFKMMPALEGVIVGVRDVPFGVAETTDSYVQGIYWMALSDGQKGIAVFNRGTMGSVREQLGALSVVLAFAMYYVWRTVMLQGSYTYDFSLLPFEGPWEGADLHRQALEYNFPLVAVGTPPGSGKLGSVIRPVAVESEGAIVSAMFPREDAAYMRLFEHQGQPASVSLRAPCKLTEVNLGGEVQGEVPGTFALAPWQIRTLRLG